MKSTLSAQKPHVLRRLGSESWLFRILCSFQFSLEWDFVIGSKDGIYIFLGLSIRLDRGFGACAGIASLCTFIAGRAWGVAGNRTRGAAARGSDSKILNS